MWALLVTIQTATGSLETAKRDFPRTEFPTAVECVIAGQEILKGIVAKGVDVTEIVRIDCHQSKR